jgi:endoglucanase
MQSINRAFLKSLSLSVFLFILFIFCVAIVLGVRASDLETDAPYNYGEVLQKSLYFYEVEYSGELTEDHRVEWRGDSFLEDGADNSVDLSGGYHDAGDQIKFALPMAQMTTLLAWGALLYTDGFVSTGQMAYLKNNVRQATDYFLKAHTADYEFYFQVGNTDNDHSFWGPPEVFPFDKKVRPSYKLDSDNPGDDILGQTAAALAASSMLFKENRYYSMRLLVEAKKLYTWAMEDLDGDGECEVYTPVDNYNSSSCADDMAWGALWLYKATGQFRYLKIAREWATRFGSYNKRGYTWNQHENVARMLLAIETDSLVLILKQKEASQLTDGQKSLIADNEEYHAYTKEYLDWWSSGQEDGDRVDYTPGGLAWLDNGALRHVSNVAFTALVYSDHLPTEDLRKQTYYDFAYAQTHYFLGDNPRGSSYVVGFGENPPNEKVHHRGAHASPKNDSDYPDLNNFTVYGCLIGGPDINDEFDQYTRHDHTYTECEIDGTAALPGLMARFVQDFGGNALEGFPELLEHKTEFYVDDVDYTVSDEKFTISLRVYNETKYPARSSDNLVVRAFVDLTEFFAAGYVAADVESEFEVKSYYCEDCIVSDSLQLWKDSIYYVDIDWNGADIVPNSSSSYKRKGKVQVSAYGIPDGAMDVSNDPSYLNVDQFVIYEGGILVNGIEP